MSNAPTYRITYHNAPSLLMGSAIDLMRPMLCNALIAQHLLGMEDNPERYIPLYESILDYDLAISSHPMASCIWWGYDNNAQYHMRAADSTARFWFMPTKSAMYSWIYFNGKHDLPFEPRTSVIIPDNLLRQVLMQTYNASMKFSPNKTVTLGLWLADLDDNYMQKVRIFVDLWDRFMLDNKVEGPTVKLLLLHNYGKAPPVEKALSGTTINTVKIVGEFLERCDAYVSLATTPTVYDPMIDIFTALSIPAIFSAPRYDTLNHDFILLDRLIVNGIDSIMAPNSPGITNIAPHVMPAFENMLTTLQGLVVDVRDKQ